MIPIAQPAIGPEEIAAVKEVLESGMLAQGPKVSELEASFAAYCGTKYAVALSSGTAALHTALLAAGVQAGDEVITTPFSFIATVNTILMVGAKPVLVDIDPKSCNLSASLVEKAVTPQTKAILPVHLYGQPCDVEQLESIAAKHKLLIIEDACQAVGATYKNKKAGAFGDFGCFSLYATKNIVSGEGGIVTTNRKEYADAMKRFRQHGMSGTYEYEHLGYNYRLTDIQAAVAVEQLKKVSDFTQARQANAARLDRGLKGVKGLVGPTVLPNRTHVYNQYTIRITKDFPLSRDEVAAKLREKGIGAGIYYPKPLHAIPHIARYGYAPGDFPEAERAAAEVLSLPVHPGVSEADIATIVSSVKELAA